MTVRGRTVRRTSLRAGQELRDLVQGVLVAELLAPSQEFWLISPWISDVAVIDNSDGAFNGLDPNWPAQGIGLLPVLAAIATAGTELWIETRPDDHNKRFVSRLQDTLGDEGFHLRYSPVLHEKGLLGDGYVISGSMNFTVNGLFLLDEAVRLDTEPDAVAQARLAFRARWAS
ncbi:phospholipase D-like domain-containing protein DpdK [Blastococcus sp. SYSU DS0510]